MSVFNSRDDSSGEEEQQTRPKAWRGLPLWLWVVIGLLVLAGILCLCAPIAVFISLWSPFTPPTQPTAEVVIPTVTPALPTVAPFPTATATPKPTPTPSVPAEITVGGYVKVVNIQADRLRFRSGPGEGFFTKKLVRDGAILKVLDGPEEANGYIWWRLEDEDGDIGWAAEKWLEPTLP